jgi:hypothetical protein
MTIKSNISVRWVLSRIRAMPLSSLMNTCTKIYNSLTHLLRKVVQVTTLLTAQDLISNIIKLHRVSKLNPETAIYCISFHSQCRIFNILFFTTN